MLRKRFLYFCSFFYFLHVEIEEEVKGKEWVRFVIPFGASGSFSPPSCTLFSRDSYPLTQSAVLRLIPQKIHLYVPCKWILSLRDPISLWIPMTCPLTLVTRYPFLLSFRMNLTRATKTSYFVVEVILDSSFNLLLHFLYCWISVVRRNIFV
jgi:hypothetical protein